MERLGVGTRAVLCTLAHKRSPRRRRCKQPGLAPCTPPPSWWMHSGVAGSGVTSACITFVTRLSQIQFARLGNQPQRSADADALARSSISSCARAPCCGPTGSYPRANSSAARAPTTMAHRELQFAMQTRMLTWWCPVVAVMKPNTRNF